MCTNLHLQHKDVAVGRLVGVQQPDQVGMVQSLQESDLLQDLLSAQQLLVHMFCCYRPFGPPLVTALGHGESAPGGQMILRVKETAFYTLDFFFPITYTNR